MDGPHAFPIYYRCRALIACWADSHCPGGCAGAWEGGSQIFEAPEAVNSVTAPEVSNNDNATDGSVAAVVITLPGGCAYSAGAASASVHGITTGGDAVAVSAGQEGARANVYVAVEGVGPSAFIRASPATPFILLSLMPFPFLLCWP